MKTIVIGGGPSGMMAAITASQNGDTVILLEKEKTLGQKLLMTGKGRCNITSSLPMSEFMNNIPGNGKFLFSCFQEFTNQDIIDLLKKHGLEVKQERGNRIFPVTDRAQSVLDCLLEELKEQKVDIRTNCEVVEIRVKREQELEVILKSGEIVDATKVILATRWKKLSQNRFKWFWLSNC